MRAVVSSRLVSSRLGKRKKKSRQSVTASLCSLRTLCCLGHACPSPPAPRPSMHARPIPVQPSHLSASQPRRRHPHYIPLPFLAVEPCSHDTIADIGAHATARSPAAPLRIIRLSSHPSRAFPNRFTRASHRALQHGQDCCSNALSTRFACNRRGGPARTLEATCDGLLVDPRHCLPICQPGLVLLSDGMAAHYKEGKQGQDKGIAPAIASKESQASPDLRRANSQQLASL